jgi:hypothetical protein
VQRDLHVGQLLQRGALQQGQQAPGEGDSLRGRPTPCVCSCSLGVKLHIVSASVPRHFPAHSSRNTGQLSGRLNSKELESCPATLHDCSLKLRPWIFFRLCIMKMLSPDHNYETTALFSQHKPWRESR